MTNSCLKASQKLFLSAISINPQTNFIRRRRAGVIVSSLLCSVLGLWETASWQGTMRSEVFTDLYKWLRGAEWGLRRFSQAVGFRINFRRIIKVIISVSDNVSVWWWRALLAALVRYRCQILNQLILMIAHRWNHIRGDFLKRHCEEEKKKKKKKAFTTLIRMMFCTPGTFWLTFHTYL